LLPNGKTRNVERFGIHNQSFNAFKYVLVDYLGAKLLACSNGNLAKSPLLLAVEQNLCKVVEALCKKGASLCEYSDPESSPLWIALDKNFWDVASVLVRFVSSNRG
jgi:hypothetical protein